MTHVYHTAADIAARYGHTHLDRIALEIDPVDEPHLIIHHGQDQEWLVVEPAEMAAIINALQQDQRGGTMQSDPPWLAEIRPLIERGQFTDHIDAKALLAELDRRGQAHGE